MAQKLNPFSGRQFLDANGDPYVGAQLFTYVAGSSTKASTTKDSAGASSHANPIILNSRGEPGDGAGASQAIWQAEGVSIKLVLAPATDTDPPIAAISTWDNLNGVNDISLGAQDQWVSGPAPTYVSTVSFTLVGDQTTDFHVGRRIKSTNSGGTIYSTITDSAYTSLTTITVSNDSGSLDSGMSAVSYGLITAVSTSTVPQIPSADAGGAVDAITATFSPATGLVDDAQCIVRAAGANATTTPTFAPNGETAKTIVKGGNNALNIGDIGGADHDLVLKRNTTNDVWELLNPNKVSTADHTVDLTHWALLDSTEVTGSAVSAISFTDLPAHEDYLILFRSVQATTDTASFEYEQGYGATPTWVSSGYKYHVQRSNSAAATYLSNNSPNATEFLIALDTGTGTNEFINGQLRVYNAQSTDSPKAISSAIVFINSAADLIHVNGSGESSIAAAVANPITAFRFTMSSGNIDIGSIISVYGLETSTG